jgi:pimeloyl-ACP methyl ester carboxylesterase
VVPACFCKRASGLLPAKAAREGGPSGGRIRSLLKMRLFRALATAIAALTLALALPPTAVAVWADELLTDFPYRYPVAHFAFTSQRQALSMAYMDVRPERGNGRVIVLLHGKNFCGGTWDSTITALSAAGYRVIVPDQIGFCKSSKPEAYQFSFHQLASNTRALLAALGVEKSVLLGHSTGGMLAFRYALSYPEKTVALAVVNPIGLEDWKAKGVPMATVDELFDRELHVTADGIRRYEQATYYAGSWRPEFDRWVDMLASLYGGEGGRKFAWDQALTSDMIFSQPVVYEFARIAVPTLLLIGQKDITAIGKERAPPEVAGKLGNYPELGRQTQASIPGSVLVPFADLGHAPQIQDPERFNRELLGNLERLVK